MDLLILFRDYLQRLPDKPSDNTVKNYVSDVAHFKKWIGEGDIRVTPIQLRNFKQFLQNASYSPATIERHISSLKKYFQFLSEQTLISQNPFDEMTESINKNSDDYHLRDFRNFLYVSGKGENTMKNYLADVAHFFDWLEKTQDDYDISVQAKMAKINGTTISEYKKKLLAILKLSVASVNRKLSSLRAYCQWATEKGFLKENPFSELPITNYQLLITNGQAYELENQYLKMENGKPTTEYSKFPPIRLAGKILGLIDTFLLATIVVPLNHLLIRIQKMRLGQAGTYIKSQSQLGNIQREFYAGSKKPNPKIRVAGTLILLALLGGGSGFFAYQRFFHPPPLPMAQEKTSPIGEVSKTETLPKEKFVFSARLADKDNNPITKTSLVIFTFYDDPESFKDVLYQEVVDVTPNDNGFFTIKLEKVPKDLLTSLTPVYLGITVQGDGEMKPRALITGKEQGVSAFFDSEGKLLIAKESPSLVAQSGSFTITGAQVIIRTKEGSDGSIVLWPDGDGKIDILSPLTNSITGLVKVNDALAIHASAGNVPFSVNVAGASLFTMDSQGAISAKTAEFAGAITPTKGGTYDLGTSVLAWKTIYASNVVGAASGTQGYWQRNAGAISPSNLADDLLIGATATSSAHFRVAGVNGNITTSGDIAVNGGDITTSGALTITPGGGKNLAIALSTTGDFSINSGQFYVDTSSGNVGIGTSSPQSLFAVGGRTLTATSSGNVGIGTTSPAGALDVRGRVLLDATVGSSSTALCYSGGATTAQVEDCSSSPTDLAENFGTLDPSIEAGDVVVVSGEATEVVINGRTTSKAFMKKSERDYEETILGIVSTDPNEVYGDDGLFEQQENPRPVSLAGRVPVKVSLENGPIAPGDYVTSSSIPGVAMKATRAGPVVGKALENFDNNKPGLSCSKAGLEKFCQGKIIVFLNVSWYDPGVFLTSSGKLMVQKDTYSGLLNDVSSIKHQVSSIEDLESFIRSIIEEILNTKYVIQNTDHIVSPLAQIDSIKTNTLSPLASDTILIDGRLEVRGSASISGELTADKIRGNQLEIRGDLAVTDATIAGTLQAKEIVSDTINNLRVQIASLSSHLSLDSGSSKLDLEAGNSKIENQTSNLQPQNQASSLEILSSTFLPSASDSATLRFNRLFATTGGFLEGLLSIGPAGFSDVSVSGILSLGPQFILHENQINVLGSDLALQSLSQGGVSIASGKVYIDSMGNLKATSATIPILSTNIIFPIPNEDLVIRLGTTGIKGTTGTTGTKDCDPRDTRDTCGTRGTSFIVQNASSSAVLRITDLGDLIASGSAQFTNIKTAKLTLPEIIEKIEARGQTQKVNGSVGKGTIPPGTYEITIETPLVTENSLIYVTPTTNTRGQIPYLARQIPEESFTVGIDDVSAEDISFNWWIIN